MADSPQQIREQMKATRDAIDTKLRLLEFKARRLNPRRQLGWAAAAAATVLVPLGLFWWRRQRRR